MSKTNTNTITLLLDIAEELEKLARRIPYGENWRFDGVSVGLFRFASNVRAIAHGAGRVLRPRNLR